MLSPYRCEFSLDDRQYLRSLTPQVTGMVACLPTCFPSFALLACLPVEQLGPLAAPLDLTDAVMSASSHLQEVLLQARAVLSLTLTNPLSCLLLNHGDNSGDLGTNEKTHLCPCCLPFQMDTAARGGQPCLWALAASSLLAQEAPRLTFRHPFSVPPLCLRISSHTRVSLLWPLT